MTFDRGNVLGRVWWGLWGNVRARFVVEELGLVLNFAATFSGGNNTNYSNMASPTCLARGAPAPMLRSVAQGLLTAPTKRFKTHLKKVSKGGKIFATPKCAMTQGQVEKAFKPGTPLRLKKMFQDVPAHQKWINEVEDPLLDPVGSRPKYHRGSKNRPSSLTKTALNTEYLQQFGDMTVPLERSENHPQNGTHFERFDAPFSLLLGFMEAKDGPTNYRLYLAQHSLDDLPEGMRVDLPTPEILKSLGWQGDIYGSSLWMGRPPTHTPLHRDPNPNLMVQISGKKTVRLIKPEAGLELYENVKEKFPEAAGSANLRGEEMMQGKLFNALESAVWVDKTYDKKQSFGLEVTLKKGDGLYIPTGWWHAVKGTGKAPNITVSWS